MKQKMQKLILVLSCLFTTFTYVYTQVGEVIWQEDFNTLNTSTWNVIVGDGTGTPAGSGWGNQELEYYTTPNVTIGDIPGETGNKALILQAKSETMGTKAFTSGKVDTYGKLSIKYGLVEMRIRVPDLQTGLWPAAWLLGTATANWPAKGEIDMMEMGHNLAERTRQGFPSAAINNFVGSNLIFYSSSAVSSSNPSGAASIGWDVNYDSPYVSSTPLNDRFLIYRMYWTSTSIRFTVVDGAYEIDLYTSPFTLSSESDEYNNPFYFLLNLAVGGTFTDATSNAQVTAPLPAKMYIDYIKVSKWNNQGSVTIGTPLSAETGTFGVFTDNTTTTNKLVAGTSSDIYAWNNLVAGTTAAYEGSNVIAWATSAANTWFGGGVMTKQPRNMSNFSKGNLKFRIKIPANVSFKIGMTDNYTNQAYVTFPANTTVYGLTRNGNWGQVTIPISDFSGLLAFQSMGYMFTIVSVDGQLPTTTFQFAIDDIYWEGGGSANAAPTVSITTPATGVSYSAPASISIAAIAADADGTISKVEFYNGTTLLGSDAISPYTYSWTNVAAGTYSITAQATDNSGATTTSEAVSVTVKAASTGCTITGSTVDYKTVVSNDESNPTLTFVPVTSGAGSKTCILYYSTNPNVTFPGYMVTANTAYRITAAAGQTVYFYYTYSLSAGGENTTLNNKNSFTVGNCSSLKMGYSNMEIQNSSGSFDAFPVPMNDQLNLKFNRNTWQKAIITDISGKIIIVENIMPDLEEMIIDVSRLSNGAYYLTLQGGSTKTSKMIIK